jgi:serine protease Do
MRRLGLICVTAAVLMAASSAMVRADVDIDAKAKEVTKSLVSVEYTLRNENASHEEAGQGILIHKDGIILISGALMSESYPMEWVKDIKVRLPWKNFTGVSAKFIGRTRDRLFAFLKTEKPIDGEVFTPGEMASSSLGEQVFSVALMSKAGGYGTYVGTTRVKALIPLSHLFANTDSFGLTRGMSPVYDLKSGQVVGLTTPALGESMILRDGSGARNVQLIDDDQSSSYLPAEEVQDLFKNIPTQPFESPRPWLAVDELTGTSEDMRALKHIEQPAGVMIGSVIPNEPADKAGLQAQDIVLTVDGKEFSTSSIPELMVMHFSRALEKHAPGDKVVLGILRDGKKMDIPVTLGESPKTGGEMPYAFSPKVGVSTRDLVFGDAYARRLPQDTKGVMVALVKTGAPASLGSTPLRSGYLITKVNDQPINDQTDFTAAMKKIDDSPDMKEAVFVVIQSDGNTEVCRIDLTK